MCTYKYYRYYKYLYIEIIFNGNSKKKKKRLLTFKGIICLFFILRSMYKNYIKQKLDCVLNQSKPLIS